MKKLHYFLILCFSTFLFASCQSEEPVKEPEIRDIMHSSGLRAGNSYEIEVKIQKPTPCHQLSDIQQTTSNMSIDYNIILLSEAEICAQVIEEETITVVFEPWQTGEYTLNFSINGQHKSSRRISVN